MNAQAALTDTPAPGPFFPGMLASAEDRFEDQVPRKENKVSRRIASEVSPKTSAGATTAPGAVIRSARDALEAQSSQPAMVNLGPALTLLTMLRHRPRRNRICWQELSLPPGCVLAARYASR